MKSSIIDAHAHCGRLYGLPAQDFEDYIEGVGESGIGGVVMFPPVMEIYDRHAPDFEDNPEWQRRRREANAYLLTLGNEDFEVTPYLFIWNDFAVEQLSPHHRGIKWHRHADEPRYHYDDPRCRAAIDEIRRRNMPVCLEEEFHNTLRFIDDLAPGVRVIIPHCGFLNGGYESFHRMKIWGRPHIYTDTSLAPRDAILHYITNYGHERIMFGSDFPFGDPAAELRKILRLHLSDHVKEAIIGGSVRRLLASSNQ